MPQDLNLIEVQHGLAGQFQPYETHRPVDGNHERMAIGTAEWLVAVMGAGQRPLVAVG